MIALITGASRGIGRAIALRLAQDYSATLVLVYRSRKADAEETAQQCRVHGSTVHIEQVDVGQSAEADRLVKATIERHGRIDVLINNAGITADGLTLQMSDDDWHNVLNTNPHSVFSLARCRSPDDEKARPHHQQAVFRPVEQIAGKQLRRKAPLKPSICDGGGNGFKKITVNAVAPGVIETEMSARIRDAAGKEIARSIPRRFGQPEEVGSLVILRGT